jgi:hypothetical protein
MAVWGTDRSVAQRGVCRRRAVQHEADAGFWKRLQQCSHLKTLHVSHRELSHAIEYVRLHKLRDVSLAGCSGMGSCQSFFSNHPFITRLDLSGTLLCDDELEDVVRLLLLCCLLLVKVYSELKAIKINLQCACMWAGSYLRPTGSAGHL